ncbi:MAG: 4Fe-4S dicluster domain-containing protein [Spirochaetales bacterium]|nr:4Fe-4S dicluster domain-containing protein [Spirochaetales bacterium]
MKIDIKGIWGALSSLKYLFQPPGTLRYPDVKKEAADGYRGFHDNDLSKCIGCGMCEDICMNLAIDMVKPKSEAYLNAKNGSGLIPRLDYGRCCWCSLCTDVCPVNSLKLTKNYVYVSEDMNRFIYTPGEEKLGKREKETVK